MSEKESKQILSEILTDGRIIKEGFTGVYFMVKGEKLLTSLKFIPVLEEIQRYLEFGKNRKKTKRIILKYEGSNKTIFKSS